jgi:hypothetical protein
MCAIGRTCTVNVEASWVDHGKFRVLEGRAYRIEEEVL